jgi:hypothetical protein
MDDRIPSCAADAVRNIRRIDVAGREVGIANLDGIIEEVIALSLEDERMVRAELVRRVRIFNYIPPKIEPDYADALGREYKKKGTRL